MWPFMRQFLEQHTSVIVSLIGSVNSSYSYMFGSGHRAVGYDVRS